MIGMIGTVMVMIFGLIWVLVKLQLKLSGDAVRWYIEVNIWKVSASHVWSNFSDRCTKIILRCQTKIILRSKKCWSAQRWDIEVNIWQVFWGGANSQLHKCPTWNPKSFFALSKKSENHSDTWKIFWHVSFFVHGSNERKVKVIPVFEIFLCKIQNRLHSIVMCTNEDSQKYFVLTSLAIWLLRFIWIWIWIQLQQFFGQIVKVQLLMQQKTTISS